MNPTPLTLDLSALQTKLDRACGPLAPARRSTGGQAPQPTPSPTLDLTRSCAQEVRAEERAETTALLLVAGCALVAIAGSVFDIDRALANWSSFENLVHALLG